VVGMNRRLTLEQAATMARSDTADVKAALASGELRSLKRRHVETWIQAEISKRVLPPDEASS